MSSLFSAFNGPFVGFGSGVEHNAAQFGDAVAMSVAMLEAHGFKVCCVSSDCQSSQAKFVASKERLLVMTATRPTAAPTRLPTPSVLSSLVDAAISSLEAKDDGDDDSVLIADFDTRRKLDLDVNESSLPSSSSSSSSSTSTTSSTTSPTATTSSSSRERSRQQVRLDLVFVVNSFHRLVS